MSNNQNENNTNEKMNLTEEDKKVLLAHDYDGIQEFDYPLPRWWLVSFGLTILFGVPYFVYYVLGGGPTLMEEHNVKMAVVNELKKKELEKARQFDLSFFTETQNNGGLEKGKLVFETNCVPCHKDQGIGDIGPNLTDSFWIHGKGHPEDLFKIVSEGVEEKGMPTWKEILTKEELYQAITYVHSLRNKNLSGKEAQGEKVED